MRYSSVASSFDCICEQKTKSPAHANFKLKKIFWFNFLKEKKSPLNKTVSRNDGFYTERKNQNDEVTIP